MKYSTLKNEVYQAKQTKLFDKVGLFFAFNQRQLDEGLKEIKANKKDIISIGAGGLLPKKNLDTFLKGSNQLRKWLVNEVKKLDLDDVINYELNNYECFYTGDCGPAYEVLKDYSITQAQILTVYNNHEEI